MAIEKVIQVPDRSFEPSTEKVEGSRVFEVYTDEALTDEQVILDAIDPVSTLTIPVIGTPWSNNFQLCKVTGYSFGELDEGFGRAVTVNFSTEDNEEENPEDDEWQVDITEQDQTQDLTMDPITGKNVANTAGDPTPVPISLSDAVITIKRKILRANWADKDIFKFKKSMNQAQVTINGTPWAARQLLMWNIATNSTIKNRGSFEFLDQTLVMLALDDPPLTDQNGNAKEYGWNVVLLNAGLRELKTVGGDQKLIPISDDAGNETTVAWPLDLPGAAIRPSDDQSQGKYAYIYNTFFLYREKNWGGLNLL